MKIGSAAAETNSIVNPREENRTADRSGYLDQYPFEGALRGGGW